MSQPQKITIAIPLKVELPPKKILLDKAPQNIEVTLKSNGWTLLRKITRREFEPINFSIFNKTQVSYQDLKNQIERKIDSKIEIYAISPTTLSFEIDEPLKKQVPVIFNSNISTVSQFRLSNEVQLLPNMIEISGPASVINKIQKVETKPIKIEKLRKTVHGEIELLDALNKQVDFSTEKVNYVITVEQITEKILEIPIQSDTLFQNIKISPENVKLTATISLSRFNKLKSSDFEIGLDTQQVNINTIEKLPLILKKSPDWIKSKDIKISPQEVSFFIITKKEKNE